MKFIKYQALGNDYLVIDPKEIDADQTEEVARGICDRHYGVGADGILIGPQPSSQADFGLLIYNPDGSQAEKSGNGLRIFSRYLFENGYAGAEPFTVQTVGGKVTCQVQENGSRVTVEMGQVSFDSSKIPVLGPERQVLNEIMQIKGQPFRYCASTIGNPHCTVLADEVTEKSAKQWGPLIEADARFPNRTNVQFMRVLDRSKIQIEIWERGAGYTLASGSSSCAAAATAYRLGLTGNSIEVKMPGGCLEIAVRPDLWITMTGPVERVFHGEWAG